MPIDPHKDLELVSRLARLLWNGTVEQADFDEERSHIMPIDRHKDLELVSRLARVLWPAGASRLGARL